MTESELSLYLKEIINTMNDGLFLVRPDGTVMMVNDAMLRLTGYSREELMDRPCSIMRCDACKLARATGRRHWCHLFQTGRENRKSCHFVRKDGTRVHVLKNAAVLRDESGQVLGSVETVTDLSALDEKEERIRRLSRLLGQDTGFMGMVGDSPPMRRVYDILKKAAASEAPVIILGESGTGKELAARAIHDLGPRASGPFVQLNCAALNESLLESELFGHARGAFTGAHKDRLGRFEEAGGGDIFLDEIGDVPLATQVKLLRVLETGIFERVGDSRSLRLDARLITATNRNLPELVASKRFREDFYFRINVIPIHLPPLRERREDIPLVTDHFVRALCERTDKDIPGLSPEAMALFMSHDWPGNVRELKSALEYGFVLCDSGPIAPEHLPQSLSDAAVAAMCGVNMDRGNRQDKSGPAIPAARGEGDADERTALVRALKQAEGNKSQAARILGVSRVTVLNRMRKHGIDLKKVVTG